MSGAVFTFTEDQLRAAGERFVADGAGDKSQRALRQAEVDGALNFLLSDAARKLRVGGPQPASTSGLSPEGAYRG